MYVCCTQHNTIKGDVFLFAVSFHYFEINFDMMMMMSCLIVSMISCQLFKYKESITFIHSFIHSRGVNIWLLNFSQQKKILPFLKWSNFSCLIINLSIWFHELIFLFFLFLFFQCYVNSRISTYRYNGGPLIIIFFSHNLLPIWPWLIYEIIS